MKKNTLPFFVLFVMALFPALILTYAIFNPEGMSYFHSVLMPLLKSTSKGGNVSLKHISSVQAFVGVCLLIGVVFYSKQVKNFVGSSGLLLSIAFFGTFYWMLIEQKFLSSARLSAHIILILVSLFLALSVAWPRRNKPSEQKEESSSKPPEMPQP